MNGHATPHTAVAPAFECAAHESRHVAVPRAGGAVPERAGAARGIWDLKVEPSGHRRELSCAFLCNKRFYTRKRHGALRAARRGARARLARVRATHVQLRPPGRLPGPGRLPLSRQRRHTWCSCSAQTASAPRCSAPWAPGWPPAAATGRAAASVAGATRTRRAKAQPQAWRRAGSARREPMRPRTSAPPAATDVSAPARRLARATGAARRRSGVPSMARRMGSTVGRLAMACAAMLRAARAARRREQPPRAPR